MDGYRFLLFLHIVAAMGWVGGTVVFSLMGLRLQRAGTPEQRHGLIDQIAYLGKSYFAAMSVALIVLGLGLAFDDRWDFGMRWIQLGIVGWVVSTVFGAAYLGPQFEKLSHRMTAEGADSPALRERLDQLMIAFHIEAVLLLLVVADMVLKPGL
jgi:uncharacterized membrane protein